MFRRPHSRIFSFFAVLAILALTIFSNLAAQTNTQPAAPKATRQPGSKALQIYFVDVEGGQATLFVTSAGKSLLVDTGWPGFNGRDADRIAAAVKKAGSNKIDYVLISHYHVDHVGGVPQLIDRVPVGTFIDHGENREPAPGPTRDGFETYQKVLASGKYKHIVAKPGDTIPLAGVKATILSADGAVIARPFPGARQQNPACASAEKYPADQTENARSVGMLVEFGKLRILDLADLTHDKEMKLMCPVNKLGKIDIYIVSHHGTDQSGSPALVHGIDPRVAIMDNGAKKGGAASVWDIIKKSPHLEDLWQVHYAEAGGAEHNVPAEFIANPEGSEDGAYLQLKANSDGSFSVFNSRTGQTKNYPAK